MFYKSLFSSIKTNNSYILPSLSIHLRPKTFKTIGWFSTLHVHVFHLIQKFNMAATTIFFWCWNFKIFSETTRVMNMLFCRNVSYLTLLNSFVFVHRKSKMATGAGQIKKSNSSQKLDNWLNPNWTWVIVGWSL